MGYNFPGSPSVGAVYTPVAGGASYVWDGTTWRFIAPPAANNLLLLDELPAGPTTAANQGAVYAKDVSGASELFWRSDSNGAELQLTKGGLVRGARYRATFNFSGAASPWAFRGFPPGVVGFDINVANAIAAAAGFEFYCQIANSAGTAVTSGYRGAYQVGNAAPLITPAGYPKLTGTIAASTGIGALIQWRKGSLYWAWTSMASLLGGVNNFYAFGDLPAVVDDPQGFNFGLVSGGVINGGNCSVDYWVN